MVASQRQYKRLLAQRLGGTRVRLVNPQFENCTLVDISVGGMRLLFDQPLKSDTLRPNDAVSGELTSQDPVFNVTFSGKVVWNRPSALLGEPATLVGICFSDYIPLPDSLMHLIDDFGAAE